MGALLISDLDASFERDLAALARLNGLTPEEQARKALRAAVSRDEIGRKRRELADRIAQDIAVAHPLRMTYSDSTVLIREDRDR